MSDERFPARHLTTSERGRVFITDWEGLRTKAYKDVAGIWTIGVGHTGPDVHEGLVWSKEQSDQALRVDLFEAERDIQETVRVPLSQAEFDALVSWQFNTGGLRGSTLLKRLNEGNRDKVDDEMRRWNKATVGGKKVVIPGLTARRLSESELWALGDYRTRNETTPFWESNVVPEAPPVKEVEKPPVAKKTVQGSAATSVGVVGAMLTDATSQLAPVAHYSDTLKTVFVVLTFAGVLWGLYGTYRQHREHQA